MACEVVFVLVVKSVAMDTPNRAILLYSEISAPKQKGNMPAPVTVTVRKPLGAVSKNLKKAGKSVQKAVSKSSDTAFEITGTYLIRVEHYSPLYFRAL